MAKTLQAARFAEPDWRYERKFTAEGYSLSELEMMLRLHPAGFRSAFPARDVNNIYLDTPDLHCFRTHVNGTQARFKLRIRWYGAEYGRIARPVLEMKIKNGAVGTKERFALDPFDHSPGTDIDALRPQLLARIGSSQVADRMANVQAVVFNRYRRRYYLSADHRFRLTIDTDLGFHDIGARRIGTRTRWRENGISVIELKYAVEDDVFAPDIVGALPFRLGKFSKYLRGVARLTGLES